MCPLMPLCFKQVCRNTCLVRDRCRKNNNLESKSFVRRKCSPTYLNSMLNETLSKSLHLRSVKSVRFFDMWSSFFWEACLGGRGANFLTHTFWTYIWGTKQKTLGLFEFRWLQYYQLAFCLNQIPLLSLCFFWQVVGVTSDEKNFCLVKGRSFSNPWAPCYSEKYFWSGTKIFCKEKFIVVLFFYSLFFNSVFSSCTRMPHFFILKTVVVQARF